MTARATAMPQPIFTLGHSTHPIGRFVGLLRQQGIVRLIDVRSMPASRRQPQFNRAALAAALAAAGIAYDWQGAALGGKPRGGGARADYEAIAAQRAFRDALEHVTTIGERDCCVLMCAEREPLECHRTVLVGRRLAEAGLALLHIHADGTLEPHEALEDRLLESAGLGSDDLLSRGLPRATRVQQAWDLRARAMTAAT